MSQSLGTEFQLEGLSFSLFNRVDIKNVLIKDQQKDTLLFAQTLKLRLSDLFFSSKAPVLSYIGLEKAKVYLHRKSTLWNYQFIVDHFKSNDTSKSSDQAFDLKKIDFTNIQFTQDDEWIGTKTKFEAKHVLANFNQFKSQKIEIEKLILDQPYYYNLDKPGLASPSKIIKRQKPLKKELYFNPSGLNILAKKIEILQGKIWIEYGFGQPVPYFDEEHIRMQNLNATIDNASFIADTIKASVKLSLKERSGFVIKKLATQFRMTPQMMEFAALSLKTNHSSIGNYYAMEYQDFNADFRAYLHKVNMRATIAKSIVAFDDIAFFAPALKNMHQKITTGFKFNGTVDDFKVEQLGAQYGQSFLKGAIAMKGLPNSNQTMIQLNQLNAKTNIQDLGSWIPEIKQLKDLPLEAFGNLYFQGNLAGSFYDFITKGSIATDIGTAVTSIRLQFPANKEPKYEGSLVASHLNAGKLFKIPSLGLLNFTGKIAGSSFKLDKIKTSIDGQMDSIQFNGYTYAQIQTNGVLQQQAYNGSIKIKDPNINFISNLEVNFKNATPTFNAVGDLTNANLSALQFSNNSIQLTGLLDVNFSGSNIDNFIGSAKFYNGKLKSATNTINFDSIALKSNIINGNKQINLSSDDIQASIIGKFNIDQLPNSVQYFLQGYFPNYIKNLKNAPVNQQFSFQVNTAYFEPYIRIFKNEFSGFNNMAIRGTINTDKQSLLLQAKLPYAQWESYAISNGVIGGTGNKDNLKIDLTASSFNLTDSFKLNNPKLQINTSKDQSLFKLNADSKSALAYISFEGKVNTYTDGLSIQWAPSYFILNEKQWTIQNEGEISFRKNNTYAKRFSISQGLQKIAVQNHPNDANGLQVILENVILGDLTNLFFSYPKLEGVTNATINLNKINDQFSLNLNSTINQFSFNTTLLGNTTLKLAYDAKTGIVPFDLNCPNDSYHLAAKGTYAIKDSIHPLDATLTLNQSNFGLIQEFIGGVLTDLKGKATGAIHFGGRIENPDLRGVATINDASFKVDYTKVNYFIPNAAIQFTDEGIDFGTIQVKDKLNRVAQFKGKILHQKFKHLVYDMDMQSSKIELLNMDVMDNSNFYGQAVGKAAMTIKGPEENIKMSIIAEVNDSSHIYLPNTTSKETGKSEFIVFKKLGKSIISNAETPTFNLIVDLDVSADNKTQIDVILDELTGDVIKAVGNGRIKIRAGNIEPLTMRGKYNIERGKYDFNFQSIIRKPFELIPEAGNFIEWTGNPYEADIHVDARYTAERVSLNELVGNANFSNAVKSYRGNVYVIAALRNKLAKPDIQFTLAFPPGNPISSDNEFSQFISRLERDDNEIIKQVSFLIVFNSFAPVGFNTGNSNNAYSVTTIGINSISQLLTKEINKSVTNLLNKVTGDQSLRFDIGSKVYNSGSLLDPTGSGIAINSNKIDRQRVNLKFGRSFFNDKVVVNLGGDFDFNLRAASSIQNNNFQWLPDVNIEFVLTKDRKLRAIVFNRNSLDIIGGSMGRRNRQGVSISYRKDFENFIF
ncbi:MAG: hypothetical protein WCG90_07610 [Chitinophagia bacterium]